MKIITLVLKESTDTIKKNTEFTIIYIRRLITKPMITRVYECAACGAIYAVKINSVSEFKSKYCMACEEPLFNGVDSTVDKMILALNNYGNDEGDPEDESC
jgi:hypothetical protein